MTARWWLVVQVREEGARTRRRVVVHTKRRLQSVFGDGKRRLEAAKLEPGRKVGALGFSRQARTCIRNPRQPTHKLGMATSASLMSQTHKQ